MNVWQIAAGETGRFYTDLFLDFDVMFLGPGEHGDCREIDYKKLEKEGKISFHYANRVRSFYRDVRPDDIVLLREGYRVIAIGLISEGEYKWDESLDDVYGWNLQHSRPVLWQHQFREELEAIQKNRSLFYKMKQIPTFTRVRVINVLDPIRHLFPRCKRRKWKGGIPKIQKPLGLDEFGQKLFSQGIANNSVDQVITALSRQRRLINWYKEQQKQSKRPTEHEIVAHMVLPLLLALGWSEQLLAVEWNRIDLAAFSGTPTTNDRCALVCEVKWIGHGLQNVIQQAKGYVERLNLDSCKTILLTNGARFYLYRRKGKKWEENPSGYFNVEILRENHLAPKGTNAIDTFVKLTPRNLISQ